MKMPTLLVLYLAHFFLWYVPQWIGDILVVYFKQPFIVTYFRWWHGHWGYYNWRDYHGNWRFCDSINEEGYPFDVRLSFLEIYFIRQHVLFWTVMFLFLWPASLNSDWGLIADFLKGIGVDDTCKYIVFHITKFIDWIKSIF